MRSDVSKYALKLFDDRRQHFADMPPFTKVVVGVIVARQIIHLSSECVVFSAARRGPNRRDELNVVVIRIKSRVGSEERTSCPAHAAGTHGKRGMARSGGTSGAVRGSAIAPGTPGGRP